LEAGDVIVWTRFDGLEAQGHLDRHLVKDKGCRLVTPSDGVAIFPDVRKIGFSAGCLQAFGPLLCVPGGS